VKADPPRAWSASDKADWALLPIEIREIVTRREEQRDKELRRMQNEHAAKMKSNEPSGTEPQERNYSNGYQTQQT
jgi:hypothetical protein